VYSDHEKAMMMSPM